METNLIKRQSSKITVAQQEQGYNTPPGTLILQYGVPTVIAAIAVLIIFGMTCHFVGARRRARFTLQHLLQRELEAAERRRGEIGLGEKPKMYGVYLDGTEVMENFAMKDIQPLSVIFPKPHAVHHHCETKKEIIVGRPIAPSHNPLSRWRRDVQEDGTELTALSPQSSPDEPNKPDSRLGVVTMIAMPSPQSASKSESENIFPEVVVGSTEVDWRHGAIADGTGLSESRH